MTGESRCCMRSNSQVKVLCIMPARLGGTGIPSAWGQRQMGLQQEPKQQQQHTVRANLFAEHYMLHKSCHASRHYLIEIS